jgi:hypothetical protein
MTASVRRILAIALLAVASAVAIVPTGPAAAEVFNTRPLLAGATVNDKAPTTSSWGTTGVIGAGFQSTTRKKVRSYLQFHTGILKGKRIISAELNILQIKAASCQPHTTRLYATSPISRATTWKNQPTRYPSPSENRSVAGCRGDRDWVGFDVTAGITRAARANANSATFLLAAANERDGWAWKQFDRSTATISVEYVSTPHVPDRLTVEYKSCGTAAAPRPVSATSARLMARVASPDHHAAELSAVWRRRDVTSSVDLPLTKTEVPVWAAELTWDVLEGHVYRFELKARSNYEDSEGAAKYVDSGWTAPCYFTVDVTPPPAPHVTSSSFISCGDTECPAQGTEGVPGTFVLESPAPDGIGYNWQLNDNPPEWTSTISGAAREITVTPSGVLNELTVWTSDAAGNVSSFVTYKFRVNPQ